MSFVSIVIILLILALVGVLTTGIVFMGIGGNMNKKYANALMRARVILQFLIVIGLILLYFIGK